MEKGDREDPAKIARQKKFHRLPQETKDEYAKEQRALFSQDLKSGMPPEETKAQWIPTRQKCLLLEWANRRGSAKNYTKGQGG
jgi:hypothetical protein